jgi:hypothetical protein
MRYWLSAARRKKQLKQPNSKMKKTIITIVICSSMLASIRAASPVFAPGNLVVLRGGNGTVSAGNKQTPAFVDEFSLTNFNAAPVHSVAIPTNGAATLFFNEQAGTEGGLTRSADRTVITFNGYGSTNILSIPGTPSKVGYPRGFCTVDAFTNYTPYFPGSFWFGISAGQTNPRDNVTDGTNNFWGIGSSFGMIYYNSISGDFAQTFGSLTALSGAKIINNTLYAAVSSGDASTVYPAGIYTFSYVNIDPNTFQVTFSPAPLPEPDSTIATILTPVLTAQPPYTKIAHFDINPAGTIAYTADANLGIQKYVKSGGGWRFAYNFGNLSLTNGTAGTGSGVNSTNGCFGIAVDWSGTNPVIYATTTEGFGGNINSNRVIRVVDTNSVATALTIAQISGTASASGNMGYRGLDFAPDLRPLITSEPASHLVAIGTSINFNIGVSSAFPLSYQWQESGTNLPDQTGAILSVSTSAANIGTTNFFVCIVTNQYYAVTSAPAASLKVVASPIAPIINPPVQNLTNPIGDTATITVNVSGTEPFTYQWYLNGVQLTDANEFSGTTAPTITINNTQLGVDDGVYSCAITNSGGSTSNTVAHLTLIHLPPVFVLQPSSTTVLTGSGGSMSANVFGENPYTLLCYGISNGVTIPLASGDFSTTVSGQAVTLNVNNAQLTDAFTNIYFVVTNLGGSVTSTPPITLTVFAPPAHTFVSYTNQNYTQNFDSLSVPNASEFNTASPITISVLTNFSTGKAGNITYSLADPVDFGYPIVPSGAVGGLGLGSTVNMPGWYGWEATQAPGTKLGAQQGGQTTGGIISFGAYYGSPGSNAVNNVQNRALGLLATSTTGQTAFGLGLINKGTNTLNQITLRFIGELWHEQAVQQKLQFGYLIDVAGTNSTFTAATNTTTTWVPSLNVTGFPTGSSGGVDGTAVTNQITNSISSLPITNWAPGTTLWLVWTLTNSIGGAQGIAIDNLSFSANVAPVITIPTLSGTTFIGSGGGAGLHFNFTNAPGAGASFTVWSTTNLTLPFSQWQNLGHPTESPADTYQFTDSQATNKPARFYKVTSP